MAQVEMVAGRGAALLVYLVQPTAGIHPAALIIVNMTEFSDHRFYRAGSVHHMGLISKFWLSEAAVLEV